MTAPDPLRFRNDRGDNVLTLSGTLTLAELVALGVTGLRFEESAYADGDWNLESTREPLAPAPPHFQ